MKKIFFVISLVVLSLFTKAQQIDNAKAIGLIEKNKLALGLRDFEIKNSIVSNAYQTAGTDISYIYLQQTFKNLPIYNQLLSLAFKNGELVSKFGNRIDNLENKTPNISAIPLVEPEAAVKKALQLKKVFLPTLLHSTTLIPGRKFDFGKAGIANENITAELLWVPTENGTSVKLAWQIYLVPLHTSDFWMIRIDAINNNFISENNLTVSCNWNNNGNLETQENFVTSKQKNTVHSISQHTPFIQNLSLFNQQKSLRPNIINNATYRVVPYPYESPKHGPTTSALVSNPWTSAPGNATTLNWHSIGTADYNYTRGNNVWAQEDINADNRTGVSAISSSSTDPLIFDFSPDYTQSPSDTTTSPNLRFNTTNLFYWNNIMHDVTYRYGFDEVAGNFQSNNLGRGGSGNDYVIADAQDGSGTNNANFSSPADGSSGRMQMYLWNAIPTLTINAPSSIAGQYQAVESNFSTANKLAGVGSRTGQVVYYNDNAAGTTHEGCLGVPVNSVLGKIALIDRGNCNFTVKVKNAQSAGAIAVIMVNNVAGNPIIMGGTDNTITIPAIMISITDGQIIKNALANNVDATLSVGPPIDGDVDNGVIAHEYTHGISNRLTGGPSQASCLANAENMGEGWSDYYGLMLTQDWASSNINTGAFSPRGIGTYVIGQLPNQSGIRSQRYSTDMDVNNKVYASGIPTESHDRGEIWCATLWDMTWNIINQTNTINSSIYDTTYPGGNSIALRLVTEGMKLQPCSPGFIDGRNAIIKADSILYGGTYGCAIREAFRRRGMGLYASQGSAASDSDQIADYTPLLSIKKSQSINQAAEGQNVTYTTTVSSCSPLSGYMLRDTLPSNVTYVSGGTYDATNRVVSFPVDFATGQTQNYSFVVSINTGSYFASQTLLNETVSGSTLPTGFTATSTTTNTWSISSAQSQSSPNSLFTPNAAVASDQKLETTTFAMGTGTSSLGFYHRFNTQSGYDGGMVEISTDNGTTWNEVSNKIIAGYYTNTLATGSSNPAAGRKAWSGNSGSFIKSVVNMSSYANQTIKIRFRFASNSSVSGTGWYIDDIQLTKEPVVNIRSSLFNTAGTRISYVDTVTKIIQNIVCNNVAVSAQPSNVTACIGSTATFSVTANGTNPSYQWQVSTDGGLTYSNITGANSATLTINNVDANMNQNRYKVIINNSCPSNAISNEAVLTTNTPASINTQPSDNTVCIGGTANFLVSASGTAITYQWQVSTNGGSSYTDIVGASGPSLSISNVTATQNNYKYRVVIGSCSPSPLTSSVATLLVSNQTNIINQPANTNACTGGGAVFSINATGSGLGFQWQVSTDGGNTFTNIPGEVTSSLSLSNITTQMNNNQYRVVINNNCSSNVNSNAGTLLVSNPATFTSQPANNIVCQGANASFTVATSGNNVTYQWQVSTNGGLTYTDISGAVNTTLTLNNVTGSMNNNLYRVVVFSCSPAGLNSNSAMLTVNTPANVTTQPSDYSACTGSNAIFSAAGTGTNIGYQWQVSTDGGSNYSDIPGETNSSLNLNNVTLSMNGNKYRVVISNNCPSSMASSGATLSVSGTASIALQPRDTVVCSGGTASFTSTASGNSYQWQVSTDGGSTYNNIAGATGLTLSLNNVTSSMTGNKYRLVVLGCASNAVNSNSATLSVSIPVSFTAPVGSQTACEGNTISLTANTSGTNINYQWQVSTDGGVSFTNIPGATNNTLQLGNLTSSMNGYEYQVVASNYCTNNITSNIATITINTPPSITNQPIDASVCPGNTASFSAIASGPGLSYQWQVSTNGGGSWNNINGATGNTLDVNNTTSAMNHYKYRLLVFNTCATNGLPTNEANLNILSEATIITQPVSVNVYPNNSASFEVNVSGTAITYQWQISSDGGATFTNLPGETNAVLLINNVDVTMDHYKYRVLIGANPCGNISNVVSLNILRGNNALIISPNPTTASNGEAYVQYLNQDNVNQNRIITLYDAKGSKVMEKACVFVSVVDKIRLSIKKLAAGTYILVLSDENGKTIASGKLLKQ